MVIFYDDNKENKFNSAALIETYYGYEIMEWSNKQLWDLQSSIFACNASMYVHYYWIQNYFLLPLITVRSWVCNHRFLLCLFFFCMRFKIEVMTHNMSFCMTIIRLGHFAILSMNKVSYWWVWCLLILCTHLHAQAHTVTHIFIYTCEKNHCVIELHVHVCRSRLHVGKRKKCIWCVTYMYRAYCTCMYCRNTPYVHMLVLQ